MGLLFKNLEKIGNKIALINEGKKKYTYKQIAFWAKRITSKIENGSLIIIISDNSLPSLVGYVSLMQSQHTIILLDQNFNFEFDGDQLVSNQLLKNKKKSIIHHQLSMVSIGFKSISSQLSKTLKRSINLFSLSKEIVLRLLV